MFAGRSTSSPSASSSFSVVVLLCCTFLIVVDIEHVTCMSLDRLAVDRNEIQNFEQQIHEQQLQQQQEDYNSNSNVLVEDTELELPAASNYGGDTEMYVLLPAGSVSELESVDKNTIDNVERQDLQTAEHNEEEESLNMVENNSDMLMVETNEAPAMVEAVEMPVNEDVTLSEDENKSETTQIELEQADEVMPGQEPVDSTTPLALMVSETAQHEAEEIPVLMDKVDEKPAEETVANEMEIENAAVPEIINEAFTDAEIQPEGDAEIEEPIDTETQKDTIEMETESEVEGSQSVDESESQNLVEPEALADTIEEAEKEIEKESAASENLDTAEDIQTNQDIEKVEETLSEIEEESAASNDLDTAEAIQTNQDIERVEEALPVIAEEKLEDSENIADSETQEDGEAASVTENIKDSEMEAIDSLTAAIEEMLPVEATENVSQLETEVATNEEEDVHLEPAEAVVATNEEGTQEQTAGESLEQSQADTSETEQLAEASETETVAQLLADEIETVKEQEEAMIEEKLEEETEGAKEPIVEDTKLEATEEVKEEEHNEMPTEAEPTKEEAEINAEPVQMVSQDEEVHEEIQTADEKPQEETIQSQEENKEIITEKVEEVPEAIEESVNEQLEEVLTSQDEVHQIEAVEPEIESQSHQAEEEAVSENTPKEEVVAVEDSPKEETPAVEAEPEAALINQDESQKEQTAAELIETETASVVQDEPQKVETPTAEIEPETATVVKDEPQIIEEQQPAETQEEEQKPTAESLQQDEEVQPQNIISETIAETIKPEGELISQIIQQDTEPVMAIETETQTKPHQITEDKPEPPTISTQEQHIAEEPQKTETIETSSMLATIIQVPQMQQQEPQQVQQIQITATEEAAAMPTKVENETPAQLPQQQQQAQSTQTVEAIEHTTSSTQKPLNVVDSVLNYVNASFVQQNNNRPHQQHPQQDDEMFSSKLRRYDGAQVWRIVVQNDRDKKLADELQTKFDGQLWKEVKQEVDYLLKPQVLADAARHIRAANLSRIVLIDNLQKVIEVENPTAAEIAQLQNRKGHRLTWQAYHRLADIHGFFDFLAKTYPDICSVETIGHSVQKRPLKILKISNGNAGNPGVWIDGGMHAREWISPASVTYIANQIVEGWDDLPAYMKNVNWYIHAVANPDGYEYSHTTDRLWRKNMRAHGRQCPGVDLNRNFGYKWGGKGTSANPCSQTYRGSKAFSEPETFYISKFISNFPRETFQAYLSFHSYGQYILYPWGYDYHLTNDRSDLDRVARQAGTTITKSSGVKYTVGSSATTLYPAAGGSDDWAKGIAGIKYSYTIEMGDTGRYGFVLPASFIEYNGKDGYTFVETVARAVTNTKDSRKRAF